MEIPEDSEEGSLYIHIVASEDSEDEYGVGIISNLDDEDTILGMLSRAMICVAIQGLESTGDLDEVATVEDIIDRIGEGLKNSTDS